MHIDLVDCNSMELYSPYLVIHVINRQQEQNVNICKEGSGDKHLYVNLVDALGNSFSPKHAYSHFILIC